MSRGHASLHRLLAGGLFAVLLTALLVAPQRTPRAAPAAPATPRTTTTPSNAAPPTASAAPGQLGPAADPSIEDIRDIRGPKFILSAWLIAALAAAAVLLACAVYGIWRWQKRRQRPRVLLPFERALESLDATRPLMQPATAREFSTAASDIVRRYIEERFDVTATHRTTEEFLHDLLVSPKVALARHRDLLAEFLNQCDLVKFAGISLSVRTMETLHDSARAFVLETAKPEPAPQPAPALNSEPVEKPAPVATSKAAPTPNPAARPATTAHPAPRPPRAKP